MGSSDSEGLSQLYLELVYNGDGVDFHDVDFDGVGNDIPEITHRPRTPIFVNIEPVWTDVLNLTNAHRFLFLFSL